MKELLEEFSEQGVSIFAYDQKADSMKILEKPDLVMDMMLSLEIPDNNVAIDDEEIDY